MGKLPMSVVIITRNEEANIERCILSVKDVCQDIIVVDSGSTDQTTHIAKKLGAQVIVHPWYGYSKQKNLGNAHAQYDFVFSLDADETFSTELCKELQTIFAKSQMNPMYRVNRLNHFINKAITHGAWYPDKHIRLFNKQIIHWVETDEVHEKLFYPEGTICGELKSNILHFTTSSEQYYLYKMREYARLFSSKRKTEGKSTNPAKAYSSAIFRFFKEYFLQLGFLDGKAGYKIARAHFIYTLEKYLG